MTGHENPGKDGESAGSLVIRQPENGYRFSVDALLLACHISLRPGDKVLDIGTGCGVIPLILCSRQADITAAGVEIQQELAEFAESNARENRMEDRIRIIHGDINRLGPGEAGPVDIITCNPPHTAESSGRINPDTRLAAARHEIFLTLRETAEAGRHFLRPNGRLAAVYPVKRMTEILLEFRKAELEPKKIRMVHFKENRPAERFLIQAVKQAKQGMLVLPPLFIHKPEGSYTREASAIINYPETSCAGYLL